MLFPCLLYKNPGPHQHMGIAYKYIGCEDEAHYAELRAKGWSASIDGKGDMEPEIDRDELERQAMELGITFDGRTTDKKLQARIDEALA